MNESSFIEFADREENVAKKSVLIRLPPSLFYGKGTWKDLFWPTQCLKVKLFNVTVIGSDT